MVFILYLPIKPTFYYNKDMTKKTERRQNDIYERSVSKGQTKISDLADLYQASKETIRKDLTILSDRGLIEKVHGGARFKDNYSELSIDYKMTELASDKQKIAKNP